ncbi:MAG: nucleotide exchange factor GrpE [Acidimicrobiales bacterium]
MSGGKERPGGAARAPGADLPTTDAAEAAGFGGIAWADDDGTPSDGTNGHADTAASTHTAAPPDVDDVDATDRPDSAGTDSVGPDGEDADADGAPAGVDISVEDLVHDLERVTAEREQFLEASRRLQADFENYRKAVVKREVEARERANESLVNAILPVLDACDGALASGVTDVVPVRVALLDALTREGLERIDDESARFDPARHDAIMHEPGEGDEGHQVVAEVMRAGYSWKGRVIRPAMVKVRG